MKRTLIALLAGVAVFAGAFAFAASLGAITTGSVGASAAVVASCDTDGVTTSFSSPAWSAGNKRYEVSSVNVSSIDAACNGDTIKVTLKDSTGASLGEASGAVAAGAASLAFAGGVAASAVTGIDVVIAS
jgi:hypothetical protein